MRECWSITRRELAGFFHSSIAYIFIGAFLAVSLFVVFWVDTFFARNLANVHALFQWMPLLLIFLAAAITMRMWSEERRAGTLESLLTTPVSLARLIIGKFLACFLLILITLVLTLGLPLTVSLIGPLDWGPVIGGYVAALLLASTYVAVGLFVSARTQNQIVSLIVTSLVCLALYLPGSRLVTALFSAPVAHALSLVGTGSRFDSITRGVLDVRDLYYYLSLTVAFLVLNGISLERLRWGGHTVATHKGHSRKIWIGALVIVNVLLANVWLAPLTGARVDLTHNHIYTLSPATHDELASLSEPLLIKGIFSQKTQPLLAPLVPRLKNLIREYGIAGGKHVEVRFVDPQQSPGSAAKLARRYGIKPVPFRNQSRYEASVVNAYFDVLVKYGDQFKVLDYRKLISVQEDPTGHLKVNLKAPEYALTSTIRHVVGSYQRKGNVFASLREPVTLHGYISATQDLPKPLAKLRKELTGQLADLEKQAGGKLKVKIQDPQANGGKLADVIAKRYGFQPMVASLLDTKPFYFYLLLQRGDQAVPVAFPADLKADSLKQAIITGLDQFASGMRKTVAVFAPQVNPMLARMGRSPGPRYTHLIQALRTHAIVKNTDLSSGHVPDGTQLLLVLAPNAVKPKQLFAIDQFLMTGGRVVIAASPYQVKMGPDGLQVDKHKTGLAKWLARKGISIEPSLVMDKQNATFPVPVYHDVGGLTLREYYAMPYPYFPYVSGAGLNPDSPATRALGQVTLSWASPIELDHKKLGNDKVTRLLTSSPHSWLSTSTDVVPAKSASGMPLPFEPKGKQSRHLLAVAVSGRFTSWFSDHPNPLLAAADSTKADPKSATGTKAADKNANKKKPKPVFTSIIKHSPAASRLIVIGSPSFLSDRTMGMIGAGLGRSYDQPIQFAQNIVDWSLQSPAMLNLRDKTSTSRLLEPLSHGAQVFWEYANYGLALLGLILAALIAWWRRARRRARFARWLAREGA